MGPIGLMGLIELMGLMGPVGLIGLMCLMEKIIFHFSFIIRHSSLFPPYAPL